jgi:enoyl-CoA hydratase
MDPLREDYQTLKIARQGEHVLTITLNRPDASNAMNTQMGRELMDLFETFQIEFDNLRCIVLTGAGEKAFCAGGDLKERRGMSDEAWMAQHAIFERMLRAFLACPLPVIAAVNGAAYGGGCELAAAADFVYASENARFALTEVTLGIMPGAGGTQNLPRAVGMRRAKEIILTGLPFTAEQGEHWGLVNTVVPLAQLMDAALATARRIADNAPIAIRQAKQSVQRGMQMSLWDALAFEIEAYNRMVPTEDRREGVNAFNEKRKPVFRNR